MIQWEYSEVEFDGSIVIYRVFDEAGSQIHDAEHHKRLSILLAKLGNDGWEIVSVWWRDQKKVSYLLKRPRQSEWTAMDRARAEEEYKNRYPRDR